MIRKLADKVTRAFTGPGAEETARSGREHAIRLATAVLMTEVARVDYDYDEVEFESLIELIGRAFHLPAEEAADLANAAGETAEEYVSLHSFTQLLNKSLSESDKERVVSLLWQVAFADGRLDKYEDWLVLKIADLLYVNRSRVMLLKHDANPNPGDG